MEKQCNKTDCKDRGKKVIIILAITHTKKGRLDFPISSDVGKNIEFFWEREKNMLHKA